MNWDHQPSQSGVIVSVSKPHILVTAVVSALALAALTACSSPASTSAAASGSTAGTAAPSAAASSAPAASGPDACQLVTEALVTSVLGVDPGAATSSPGFGGDGSTTCKYGSSDLTTQVSLQADLYFPASVYDKSQVSGAVDPTSGDRGYVAVGAVLVVKGKVGVFVIGTGIGSIDQGQALAAAIVGAE